MLVYLLMLCASLTLVMVSFPLSKYFDLEPTAILAPFSVMYTISIFMYLITVYLWMHGRVVRVLAIAFPPLVNTALIIWLNVSNDAKASLGVLLFFVVTSTSSTLYFARPQWRAMCSK
jgi:hypothetical protein